MCSDNELGLFTYRSMALRTCPEWDIVPYPPQRVHIFMGGLQSDYSWDRLYIFCKTIAITVMLWREYILRFRALNQGLVDSVNQSHGHFVFFILRDFTLPLMRNGRGIKDLFRKLGEFKEFLVSPWNLPSEEAAKPSQTLKRIFLFFFKIVFGCAGS